MLGTEDTRGTSGTEEFLGGTGGQGGGGRCKQTWAVAVWGSGRDIQLAGTGRGAHAVAHIWKWGRKGLSIEDGRVVCG